MLHQIIIHKENNLAVNQGFVKYVNFFIPFEKYLQNLSIRDSEIRKTKKYFRFGENIIKKQTS